MVVAMVFEQRYTWSRAYRDGEVVCARVRVTIVRGDRLGLAPRERRRYLVARFMERLHPDLRDELAALARRRGAAARRAADRMEPIEVLFDNKRQRIVASVQPPQLRCGGELREIEFGLRERS
jgi:hypothetical protein